MWLIQSFLKLVIIYSFINESLSSAAVQYPCGVEVLSTVNTGVSSGSFSNNGQYFNFDQDVVDGILGRIDWGTPDIMPHTGQVFDVWVPGKGDTKVKIWRNNLNAPEAPARGIGRLDEASSAGDWDIGDIIYFIDIPLNCRPSPCTFSIDAVSLDGIIFTFDKSAVDNIFDGITSWDNTIHYVYYATTSEIREVILTRPVEGTTASGGADVGVWEVGDNVLSFQTFVGAPVWPNLCEATDCPFGIVSVDHRTGPDGRYFNCIAEQVDDILGRADWNEEIFNVYNDETQHVDRVIMYRTDGNDDGESCHGIKDPPQYATEGFWTAGSNMYILDTTNDCSTDCVRFGIDDQLRECSDEFETQGLQITANADAIAVNEEDIAVNTENTVQNAENILALKRKILALYKKLSLCCDSSDDEDDGIWKKLELDDAPIDSHRALSVARESDGDLNVEHIKDEHNLSMNIASSTLGNIWAFVLLGILANVLMCYCYHRKQKKSYQNESK